MLFFSSFLFSERKARGDSPLCAGEGFPFLLFRIPHLEVFPFFARGKNRSKEWRLPPFLFLLFLFLFLERREIHENGRHSSSLFWKKGRERPSGGKSKKDGDSSLLATDSDSMAISFFSFSLLKGWQGDAFRRMDEKDSFPRRKTENGDPARKAVFLFFLFSEKDKKLSSGDEDEGGREKRENMPEG